MSGPFNIGDVVCCVDTDPWDGAARGPLSIRRGGVYRVSRAWSDLKGEFLALESVVADTLSGGFYSGRFRHLPKADDQFIQQMRAIKPVREGVSA